MTADLSRIHNRLLAALSPKTLGRLLPHIRPVALLGGMTIDHVDEPVSWMYFVNRGLVSLVKTMQDGRTVEIGSVGTEGVTNPLALFGVENAIVEAMVQGPGNALRISRAIVETEVASDPAFARLMQRYVYFALGQAAQTAACNRLHNLEQRCSRWVLIADDSAGGDKFTLTHQFLAMMLGAPRPSVSLAAKALQRAGYIDYVRGIVSVLDLAGLEGASCECYAETQMALDELFPARADEPADQPPRRSAGKA